MDSSSSQPRNRFLVNRPQQRLSNNYPLIKKIPALGLPRKFTPIRKIGHQQRQLSSLCQQNSGGGASFKLGPRSSQTPKTPTPSQTPKMDSSAFTPHIFTVYTGQDIGSKMMGFTEQGARRICFISASGSISTVTLRQETLSGSVVTVTHEGTFDIIKLSCTVTESGGGCFSLLMGGARGKTYGGEVVGMLKAASPVQVVLGCTENQHASSKE